MKNIKTFEEFSILEFVTVNQGANLASNSTPQQVMFDGGDGPSAMEPNDNTTHVVKKMKKFRGNNAKQKQEERKKKKNKVSKVVNMAPELVSASNFGNNGQGNSPGGGGASYATQGF